MFVGRKHAPRRIDGDDLMAEALKRLHNLAAAGDGHVTFLAGASKQHGDSHTGSKSLPVAEVGGFLHPKTRIKRRFGDPTILAVCFHTGRLLGSNAHRRFDSVVWLALLTLGTPPRPQALPPLGFPRRASVLNTRRTSVGLPRDRRSW